MDGRLRVPSGRGLIWRAGLPVVVFIAAFVGFAAGVEVSERDMSEVSLLGRAYYALGLFVIAGVDLGTPEGGPAVARAMVWAAYFLAPIITASAVIEAAVRLLDPIALKARWLQGHVIVVGASPLARLYVRRLRELDPKVVILIVEADGFSAQARELEASYAARVVVGDIASGDLLEAIGAGRARRIMLLSDDDFVNLDAAARLLTRAPWLRGRVVAHVADLGFMRGVPQTRSGALYETFNSLESAAVNLVEQRLIARFEATEQRDLVILAGFGRFGQTVLDQLQTHASSGFGEVVLIDLEARWRARSFADGAGFTHDQPCHVITGHLRDPGVWAQVDDIAGASVGLPVIVVGTSDDGLNLQVALDVNRRYPDAHVIMRSFDESPFAAEVAAETGVLPFQMAELITQAMPAAWFE